MKEIDKDFNEVEEDINIGEEKKVYSGCYKNICFEINCRPFLRRLRREPDAWTYYIYLCVDDIPEKYDPESFWMKTRDSYSGHSILANLEWHWGITYFRKVAGFDDEKRRIQVGCDYLHLEDEERHYNLDYIKNDVKRTIESFLYLMPEYGKKEDKEND